MKVLVKRESKGERRRKSESGKHPQAANVRRSAPTGRGWLPPCQARDP